MIRPTPEQSRDGKPRILLAQRKTAGLPWMQGDNPAFLFKPELRPTQAGEYEIQTLDHLDGSIFLDFPL